jgi:hypothetical protein
VVLTWNEAANIADCLASLAAQRDPGLEVVVIDAASTDATAALVRGAIADFPGPLRLEVAPRRISVGEARNRGVALARAPLVAFLSADATVEDGWSREAQRALEGADVVYGAQVHAPARWTVAAAVRGLRYAGRERPGQAPEALASHVNAAMRLEVARALPIGQDAAASAVDDVLLARRASRAGYRLAFAPALRARHRDAATARAELRKNLREGLGWGAHARELGLHKPLLAWLALLAAASAWVVAMPGMASLALLAGALWLPAMRRAARASSMPGRWRLLGALASPPFDLAFLAAYVRGLLAPARAPARAPAPAREPTGRGGIP